jgi:Leucine-rich repeat (LRR) protein
VHVACRKLWLGNNCLKQLPDSLCRIQNLRQLFVEDNQLTALPAGLEALQLQSLKVQNNPFISPLPDWVLKLQ